MVAPLGGLSCIGGVVIKLVERGFANLFASAVVGGKHVRWAGNTGSVN